MTFVLTLRFNDVEPSEAFLDEIDLIVDSISINAGSLVEASGEWQ